MNPWLTAALAVLGGLILLRLLALAALALIRPRGGLLTEAIRLLPDLLRLIPRLARDATLPRRVRAEINTSPPESHQRPRCPHRSPE